jgi:hypothetical protein
MTAEIVTFKSKPQRRRDREFVPFDARAGVYGGVGGGCHLVVRGPAGILKFIREALDKVEADARKNGGMEATDLYDLQAFVAMKLSFKAYGHNLPALK